ncbi:MAG: pentapeptide repeat-containing protein [Paenirhodobacter sp.]|uniref:pentapeptide repeat-containing protein n=1 Tax=Paenirhodobacter sp. TaxID=1965326 RepID=UPI003D0C98D0
MEQDFSRRVTTPPPVAAAQYSPAQLMRDFVSRCGMTDFELSAEFDLLKPGGRGISEALVAAWSTLDKPPSLGARRAFRALLRHLCSARVAPAWDAAFVECWARFEAVRGNQRRLFTAHHQWIRARYAQPVIGEAFALSRIYVPIKILPGALRDRLAGAEAARDEDFLRDFALRPGEGAGAEGADWLFVTGGPGSGKSALALTLAQRLSQERGGFTLFFRGTRIGGETHVPGETLPRQVDDTIAVKHYFNAFRDTSERRLTLILDGLDEIGAQSYAERRVLEVLAEIRSEIALSQAHGKVVRVIVFGRQTVTRLAADSFEGHCALYEMGDLSGRLEPEAGCEPVRYGADLRRLWWERYAGAKGIDGSRAIPRYLDDPGESLFTLSREPLLAFLIAKSAWPEAGSPSEGAEEVVAQIDSHTSRRNRNEIYAEIIERVRRGEDWNRAVAPPLRRADFVDVLQHMAVATWQNGTLRAASLKGIRQVIEQSAPALIGKFERLQCDLGDNGDPTLLTSFYYRYQRAPFARGLVGNERDYEIEFTHRTFAEYLLTTFLFDAFERLLLAHGPGRSDAERAAAERRWIGVVMAGPQAREIGRFARDEALLRFDRQDWTVWDRAKEVSGLVQCLARVAPDPALTWVSEVTTAERLQRASGAILLFWGALNQVRSARRDSLTELELPFAFESIDFQFCTPFYSLNCTADAVIGDPVPDTFSVQALSGVFWDGGEVPGYYASGGEVTGSRFELCSFEGGVWSAVDFAGVRFTSCNLRRSRFVTSPLSRCRFEHSSCAQSTLKDARISDTKFVDQDFSQAAFFGMRFAGCRFEDTRFDRADFEDCSFTNCVFEDCSFDQANLVMVGWRDCVFSDCSFEQVAVAAPIIENCSGMPAGMLADPDEE